MDGLLTWYRVLWLGIVAGYGCHVFSTVSQKNNYKNYQRKNGKSALITNEGATVNTWAGFTMVLTRQRPYGIQ